MSLINEIAKNLTEGTINDDIEWKISRNLFNSDTQKYFESFSVDAKTKFIVQVYLDNKLKLQSVNLHIHNENLVDGFKIFLEIDYKEISQLGDVIYKKYIQPNITQKVDDDTYKDILSNMFSKQYKRDQRIDDILEEGEEKSIFNRLFGK